MAIELKLIYRTYRFYILGGTGNIGGKLIPVLFETLFHFDLLTSFIPQVVLIVNREIKEVFDTKGLMLGIKLTLVST